MTANVSTTFTICADAVTGTLWEPGVPGFEGGIPGYKAGVSEAFDDTPGLTLRDMALLLLEQEAGDFRDGGKLASPYLVVTRQTEFRRTSRFFDLSGSRSLADLIDPTWAGFPASDDDHVCH